MAHMTSGFYRDRLGFDPDKEVMASSNTTSRSRTVAAYSSSSLSRQEMSSSSAAVTGMREQYQQQTSSSSSRGHYAVSSHVGNGGHHDTTNGSSGHGYGGIGGSGGGGTTGMIQQHGQYEQNLEKFKGSAETVKKHNTLLPRFFNDYFPWRGICLFSRKILNNCDFWAPPFFCEKDFLFQYTYI